MAQVKDWFSAFRLRTLPLAFSCIIVGSASAFKNDHPDFWLIFALALLTTLFLQVLSNLANDLGDTLNGADSDDRKGPKRAVQTGVISIRQMKTAVIISSLLSLVSGISLLLVSFGINLLLEVGIFFALGLASIAAAIKYTMGKNPYGYSGLGDLFVFIFFGLVGVLGSNFLYSKSLDSTNWYLAISVGLLSVGVLNINNIRDIKSDFKAGKISIPVRLGAHYAALYHLALIAIAMALPIIYCMESNLLQPQNLLFVLAYPFLGWNCFKIATLTPCQMNPYLKQLALSTFLFSILFSIAINL